MRTFTASAKATLAKAESKFSSVLTQARPIIEVLASVDSSGIFSGVPVVGNILSVASFVQSKIDNIEGTDEALENVSSHMLLVSATIDTISSIPNISTHHALRSNLSSILPVVEGIRKHTESYLGKMTLRKLAASDADIFTEDLAALEVRLETLHFAVTGETFAGECFFKLSLAFVLFSWGKLGCRLYAYVMVLFGEGRCRRRVR